MKNQIVDGGEAILEALRNLSVEYVICSPGSEWPPLWEAFARQKRDGLEGPSYIDCGHESIAVTMAHAYTLITGKMQAVVLHAGAGLLQGSMAISAARVTETPMLVMSGESLTYGDNGFDPGPQWYRNLGVVGGPQRLLEPVVKWAQSAPVSETLYHSMLRAGELAQRSPRGPTYLCVSMEAMMQPWEKPRALRNVPAAPQLQPTPHDIDVIAHLIAQAECPIISTLTAGPNRDAFDALVELAELAAIPVVEGLGAYFANFPKSNDLYIGTKIAPYLKEMDLALLVDSWAPWYPPSNAPNATIVAISESPLRSAMVYQVLEANHYLEGNLALSLRGLTEALRKLGMDAEKTEARRKRWKLAHDQWWRETAAVEEKASTAEVITIPCLMNALREAIPEAAYIDETIVHSTDIREHVQIEDSCGYFRAPSGLGQGFGYALGVKLAVKDRPVVFMVGDGSFIYNPVLAGLAVSNEYKLPVLTVICNNMKYAIMEKLHNQFYPESVSRSEQDYRGVHLYDSPYQDMAKIVGGYGKSVSKPAELRAAIAEALQCVKAGRPAILNVMMPDAGVKRR